MKRVLSFLLIWLVSSVSLFAQYQQITDAKKLNTIKTELAATYKKISSVECNYLMEKSVSLLETKMTGEGKVMYRKSNPEELFWSSSTPNQSSFYMKNDSIEITNKNGSQKMLIQDHLIFREVARIVRGGSERESIIDEDTFYADFFENGSDLIVSMTPKKSRLKTMFKTIEVVMDGKTKKFKEINITDGTNNVLNIKILDAIVI